MRRVRDQGIKRTQGPGDEGTRGPRDQRTRGAEDHGTRRPKDPGTKGREDQGTKGSGKPEFVFPINSYLLSRVLDFCSRKLIFFSSIIPLITPLLLVYTLTVLLVARSTCKRAFLLMEICCFSAHFSPPTSRVVTGWGGG